MSQRGRSNSRLDNAILALIWLSIVHDLREIWKMNKRIRRADLDWLKNATEAEGKRLALKVKRGEITRADVEAALKEYGDAEPAIALRYLDEWGIR